MTFFPKPRNINVERYIGGLSKLKNIKKPIKLSANESALGPSPKAIRALEKDKYKILKYPESDSDSLRLCLSKKLTKRLWISFSKILEIIVTSYYFSILKAF